MPVLRETPPHSEIDAVMETLHGVTIADPYRWLEDQKSWRTRKWVTDQTNYTRRYLDLTPGRERIRERMRALLDVETYDSLQPIGNRYCFRKRLPGQEQPCICLREGSEGADEVLIDPSQRGTGPYTAVRPVRISPDGRLLLYEIKQGGERSACFEVFDLETRTTIPDKLPRGYLRGFAFSPDSKAFYYVHDALQPARPHRRAAYKHVMGTEFAQDDEVFFAGEDEQLRLVIIPGERQIGFLVVRFSETSSTDFYIWEPGSADPPQPVIRHAECKFGPVLLNAGRTLAITDCAAPNFKIVEVQRITDSEWECRDIVQESDAAIKSWAVIANRIFISYFRDLRSEIAIFDFSGRQIGQVPVDSTETVTFLSNSENSHELLFERESFLKPVETCSFSIPNSEITVWSARKVPFEASGFDHVQVSFRSADGTDIPMFLIGRREVLDGNSSPTIMTGYGGYGVSMSPQFSTFVAFLMERGCVFALPNIRGGSEFGAAWHRAAKRRNRKVAISDFISAADWLIATGRAHPNKLAVFGGSNSGLLVASAMTQRPDLFRAVLCMVPMLDMLRYHLFENAHIWKDELGTAEDGADFAALLGYSPYHNVHDGMAYPATMIVSGDADQNCSPVHALKMTARLQAANTSEHPIFLDYHPQRGHSPVLPLSERIQALTNRLAFLCDQLDLAV